MATKKLSAKQQKFVVEYCKTFDAKQAAIVAGYSEKSASSIGAQLLNNPFIQIKINEAQERAAEVATITKNQIIQDCLEIVNNMKADADDAKKAMVALKALDQICKMLGYYEEKKQEAQNIMNLQINVHKVSNDGNTTT